MVVGRRLGDPKAGYLATAMVAASFVVTVGVFVDLMSLEAEARAEQVRTLFSWVTVGGLHIDLAFPLNADKSIQNVQLLIETKRSF